MSKDCPFCTPESTRIIFETPDLIALWDGFPVSPGHALVVPRRHIPTWFDASEHEQAALLRGVDRARAEILKRHKPDGFNVGINVGEAGGQTVFHLHVHVIPRYHGDVAQPRGGVRHVIPQKADYLEKPLGLKLLPGAPHSNPLVRGDDDPLLPHLLADLDRAVAADIAVAFVVRSGVRLVEEHLRDLLERRGKIRFLTGDYLDVTEPEAMRELMDLDDDLELKVFQARTQSFHPKAFVLHFPDGSGTAYVGSSNLTRTALCAGVEWNYRVVTSSDQRGFKDVLDAFENLYRHKSTTPVNERWLNDYQQRRKPRATAELVVPEETPEPPPEPHPIQKAALKALDDTRTTGNNAGLVVLATGLGKTWLSAFDSDRPEYQRVLFVAHRDEILGQAIKTFRRIRPRASIGRYDGKNRHPDAEILFASVMTLGRVRHLDRFARDRFDYIVVDEFHHACARTYRTLIDYFQPKFLLGLTATPERTDGGDLLALCGENLIYRCDAFDGIEQKLLCPFKYFGVPDEVDYTNIPWRNSRFDEEALTAAVATQKRAQNALEQFQKLAQTRTLSFCCSQRHADFMAEYFRKRDVKCVAVHSGPTSAPRTASLEQLEAGNLDVVFTVDMFNEGVDIPNIDTVLMLRPTESAVIWQQQFGRGLRNAENKTHLTVIDYIGNHRIFLTKVRSLFGCAVGDQHINEFLNLLAKGEAGLPPGCEATYDLETIEIIRSLLKPAAPVDVFTGYYRDFRERRGNRPTATEAFHDGYNPRSLRSHYGSWLRFVERMGDLSGQQAKVLKRHGQFLDALEVTPMTKSFKMLTLLAMLNEGQFPGQLKIDALKDGFRRLAKRSAHLRRDVGDTLTDDNALTSLIEENPINAWVGGRGTRDRKYFSYEHGIFETTFEVPQNQREPLQELTREIVDWRLAEYLSRNTPVDTQASFRCKVSHSGGNPILFLPDRTKHPEIPAGWVKLIADEQEIEANFVKVAVNVVRLQGSDNNHLPTLLEKWFGPDAGRPGTRSYVSFEKEAEGWHMAPFGANSREGGAEIWQDYERAAIPALFGQEFSTGSWNQGFVVQGNQVFLLVTLEKDDMQKDHRYEDRFLSPALFEWQSQNQTRRDSKRGLLLRNHEKTGTPIHLFVRRSRKINSKAARFCYCGDVEFMSWEGDQPITIRWALPEPVPERLQPVLKVPIAGHSNEGE